MNQETPKSKSEVKNDKNREKKRVNESPQINHFKEDHGIRKL